MQMQDTKEDAGQLVLLNLKYGQNFWGERREKSLTFRKKQKDVGSQENQKMMGSGAEEFKQAWHQERWDTQQLLDSAFV